MVSDNLSKCCCEITPQSHRYVVSSLFCVSGLSSFSLEKGHDRGKEDAWSLLLGSLNPNPNCVIFGLHAAVRAFAIGYLAAAAQRMQVLLVGPGMVALDIDTELRELFNSVLGALERLPKIESDKAVLSPLDLSVSTPLLLFSSQVGYNKKILGCCSL